MVATTSPQHPPPPQRKRSDGAHRRGPDDDGVGHDALIRERPRCQDEDLRDRPSETDGHTTRAHARLPTRWAEAVTVIGLMATTVMRSLMGGTNTTVQVARTSR